MKDFVAIDFETANQQRSSVCSVGLVVVRGGEVVEKIYRLIKPAPNEYSPFCQEVHGLSDADTYDAPTFPEVWRDIMPAIAGLPLVAHNAPFDQSCLKAAHDHYLMEYPGYTFHCTLKAAREKLGSTVVNHQLPTVSAHCGYTLDSHHNAIADAEACAAIAMQLL